MSDAIAAAATALFVPGHRPERFSKAIASGADLTIIDWEDAVPAGLKSGARRDTVAALSGPEATRAAAVRINAIDEGGRADLEALAAVPSGRLLAVVVPKASSPREIRAVAAALPGVPVIPLVESAAGLAAAAELAALEPVVRLGFGALDFGFDVDATSPAMLDHARCALVLASRAAGIAPALDSPTPEFRDAGAVRRGAVSARALGMGGQLCIHPSQVPIVAAAFQPTPEEIAWAERVGGAEGDGATAVDGAMVDRPVVLRAQRILARAARRG